MSDRFVGGRRAACVCDLGRPPVRWRSCKHCRRHGLRSGDHGCRRGQSMYESVGCPAALWSVWGVGASSRAPGGRPAALLLQRVLDGIARFIPGFQSVRCRGRVRQPVTGSLRGGSYRNRSTEPDAISIRNSTSNGHSHTHRDVESNFDTDQHTDDYCDSDIDSNPQNCEYAYTHRNAGAPWLRRRLRRSWVRHRQRADHNGQRRARQRVALDLPRERCGRLRRHHRERDHPSSEQRAEWMPMKQQSAVSDQPGAENFGLRISDWRLAGEGGKTHRYRSVS